MRHSPLLCSTNCAVPFNVLAIKAPGFGDRKKDLLGDIATTIGAQVVSKETGMSFETIGTEVLGRASRVVAKKGQHYHRWRI